MDSVKARRSAENARPYNYSLGSGPRDKYRRPGRIDCKQAFGRQVRITGDDQRVRPAGSEVDQLLADNALARQMLKWEPAVSLEDGLDKTIEWISDNIERYRPDVYTI